MFFTRDSASNTLEELFCRLTIEKCVINAFVKIYFKVLNDYIMICSVSSKLYMLKSESLII